MFLDDERFPSDIGINDMEEVLIVRNVQMAIRAVMTWGMPMHIYFDHDLGTNSTGDSTKFLDWIIEMDMDKKIRIPDNFSFTVHSGNPIGQENILKMNNYLEFRKNENEK